MGFEIIYESICGDESDDILRISFKRKDKIVTLEHLHGKLGIFYYGWTAEKQIKSFSLESFENFLNFIKKHGNETTCDFTTKCEDGTILNLHLEDESQHLFITTDDNKIVIPQDHLYGMYINMNFLCEMLRLIKE